jgi:hypothetical protein
VTQDVALVGGTLIDCNGGAPLQDSTVVLRDREILAVGRCASAPAIRRPIHGWGTRTGAVITGRRTFEGAGAWGRDHHDGARV